MLLSFPRRGFPDGRSLTVHDEDRVRPGVAQLFSKPGRSGENDPTPKIPAIHLARPVLLGYVRMAPEGPRVTGDGLIRVTESS
jgi:hypothetical protein